MKLREMERKSRDLERENDTLAKQLAAKSQKKIDMEQQILKIQVNEERKRAVSFNQWLSKKGSHISFLTLQEI